MKSRKSFGIRIKELRLRAGLQQKDIAKILNVSQGTYAKYELDKSQMNYELLVRIADYYDVSIDFLLIDYRISIWEEALG